MSPRSSSCLVFDVGCDCPEQSPQMRGLRDVSVRMFFSLKATHTSEWRLACRAVCSATPSFLRGSRKELSRVSACLQFRESPAQPLRSSSLCHSQYAHGQGASHTAGCTPMIPSHPCVLAPVRGQKDTSRMQAQSSLTMLL